MAMTKADIVEEIYKKADFTKKETAELVDLIFTTIKETLSRGEKVKISGFGNFSIKDKASRVGRNPQTGKSMEISSRRVLTFKPSLVLKDDITKRYIHRIDDKGNEDLSSLPKDFASKALSFFLSNSDNSKGYEHGD